LPKTFVLQGTAFITEELQDHNEIFIDIGDIRISLIAPPHQRADRGEAVTISVDPQQLLLFSNHEK
jgi:multiple sugar transport system ATP-binding protein